MQRLPNLRWLKVDLKESDSPLARQYKIVQVPHLLIFNEDGEKIAEGDDALMEKYLGGEELTEDEVEHGLMVGTKNGKIVPVLIGSAASGIGVATLLDRIVGELPSPLYHPFTIGNLLPYKG